MWASNLRSADLRQVDLRGANLFAANLVDAHLEAANLDRATLTEAVYNRSTQWPKGFDPQQHGAVLREGNEHQRASYGDLRGPLGCLLT